MEDSVMRIPAKHVPLALLAAGLVLGALTVPRPARAEWPAFGRAISTASLSQTHSVATTDGADGAIIAWQDSRFPGVNIFAQRVLASGELDLAWTVDGQALMTDPLVPSSAEGGNASPVIVSDGAGGAIVAWQDGRSPITETDIFAQHILATGQLDRAWPANGRAVVAIAGLQNELVMTSDGAGGAIIAWMDTRPGTSVVDIFAQHVLASGVVDSRWPANGLAVVTAPGRQEFPAIVSDGAGGAIISWDDGRSTATGIDVFAQHVLVSGVVDPAWPVNGRAVCVAGGGQGRGTITTDGARGAILAWSDGRVLNTFHIFAHHVLASGVVDPAWPVNGRAISAAGFLESQPLAVPDGAGGAVVTWQALDVHLNMFAQHITAAGVVDPRWPARGRALSVTPREQTGAEIVSDGAGGAIVAWEDSSDVFAQHVLASGVLDPTYPDTGRALVILDSEQGDIAVVATSGSGAIVAWSDTRNGKDTDVYALQVLVANTVDVPGPEPAALALLRPSPNPANGPVTLRFVLTREAPVDLAIFDVSGRRVRKLARGARPAGPHTITWDLRDESGRAVGAGLYFARLEAEGRSLTRMLATRK